MNRTLLASAFLLVIVIVVAGYWFLTQDDRNEQRRYEQGETELVISNLANSTLTLFKAGKNLADTIRVTMFEGKNIWLNPGRYFLRSDDGGRSAYTPVPLSGYRCGPDKDGSFLVTIRLMPEAYPPRLLNSLPEFIYISSGNFLLGDRQNPREPHYVWLTGYFIAPFEVTNGEFREFLNASDGYNNAANWTAQGRLWKPTIKSHVTSLLKPTDADYKRFGMPDQPVAWVTWYEANAFCKWLSVRYADQ
ncbi:MAG: SUMF1/EgtB/PvdO family nonheme iron enzyme, partial [bacterium]